METMKYVVFITFHVAGNSLEYSMSMPTCRYIKSGLDKIELNNISLENISHMFSLS